MTSLPCEPHHAPLCARQSAPWCTDRMASPSHHTLRPVHGCCSPACVGDRLSLSLTLMCWLGLDCTVAALTYGLLLTRLPRPGLLPCTPLLYHPIPGTPIRHLLARDQVVGCVVVAGLPLLVRMRCGRLLCESAGTWLLGQ